MPFLFVIPGPLRELAGNRAEVSVGGRAASVGDALALLWATHPAIRDRVLTERGTVRPHMSVFVNGEDVRFMGGLDGSIPDGAEIFLVPALSGGCQARLTPRPARVSGRDHVQLLTECPVSTACRSTLRTRLPPAKSSSVPRRSSRS